MFVRGSVCRCCELLVYWNSVFAVSVLYGDGPYKVASMSKGTKSKCRWSDQIES